MPSTSNNTTANTNTASNTLDGTQKSVEGSVPSNQAPNSAMITTLVVSSSPASQSEDSSDEGTTSDEVEDQDSGKSSSGDDSDVDGEELKGKLSTTVEEGQLITRDGWIGSAKVVRKPAEVKKYEVDVEEMKKLQKNCEEAMANLASFLDKGELFLKGIPSNEKKILGEVQKILGNKVNQWKPKIEESIAGNKKVIELEIEPEAPTVIQMSPKKVKRKATTTNLNNAPPKKKKAPENNQPSQEIQQPPQKPTTETAITTRPINSAPLFRAETPAPLPSAQIPRPKAVQPPPPTQNEDYGFPWGASVCALELMKVHKDYRFTYSENMVFLDSSKCNRGSAGVEVGTILAPPLETILQAYSKHVKFASKYSPDLKLNNVPKSLFDAPSEKWFLPLLRAAPRLVQVGLPDDFWTPQHINFDMIKKGQLEADGEMSASWMAICQMMCRSSRHQEYSDSPAINKQITLALNRVNQCAVDSVMALNSVIEPVKSSESEGEFRDIHNAINLMLARSMALGAGTGITEARKTTKDGLNFLMKHITDLLLGMLLIHEATQVDGYKDAGEGLSGSARKVVKLSAKKVKQQSIMLHGVSSMTAYDWRVYRKVVFGGLATFLLFGVAGWWGLLHNHRKFKLGDVYGLITIAEQRALVIGSQDSSSIHSSHPFLSGSWKHLNGFIVNLLVDSRFSKEDVDFVAAQKLWLEQLTADKVAQLFLMDLFEELYVPGDSITPLGKKAPSVDIPDSSTKHRSRLLTQALTVFPNLMQAARSQRTAIEIDEGVELLSQPPAASASQTQSQSQVPVASQTQSQLPQPPPASESRSQTSQPPASTTQSIEKSGKKKKADSGDEHEENEGDDSMSEGMANFIDDLEASAMKDSMKKNKTKKMPKRVSKYVDLEARVAPPGEDDE